MALFAGNGTGQARPRRRRLAVASTTVRVFAVALSALVFCSCGGGGGEGQPSPGPTVPPNPNGAGSNGANDDISFVKDTDAGLSRDFGREVPDMTDPELFSGGIAAADYDGDGDVDLYVVGGNTAPNALFEDRGDGTYEDVAPQVGLDLTHWGSGPAFGDIDGDGDLDLFIGAVERHPVSLYENRLAEQGRFVDITAASGIVINARNTIGATFFDYDRDGYLDLFVTHWQNPHLRGDDTETVFRNNGDRTFSNRSFESGIAETLVEDEADVSFSANFADIDGDGDSDLLMSSDFDDSQVYRNNDDGTFTNITDQDVIIDQNGMGGAVGDFDNDGNIDWFVTSIYNLDVTSEPEDALRGNRFYRNTGDGIFEDVTTSSGTADGGWGWGACAADLDNDGRLDIVHVNGGRGTLDKDYRGDSARFFHNAASGRIVFNERALAVGLDDDGQGRGIACFDADGDGDVDVVISNNDSDNVVFYRNATVNENHHLRLRLVGDGANRHAVGAHVFVTADGVTQVRVLGAQNHYVSHGPLEVHFGLGAATTADVRVRWPDGAETRRDSVAVDQYLSIEQAGAQSERNRGSEH